MKMTSCDSKPRIPINFVSMILLISSTFLFTINAYRSPILMSFERDQIPVSASSKYRREVLKVSGFLGSISMLPMASYAKVFFDTDAYGDKELKIATVNSIKQKLRNVIQQDIRIAPYLLKLAINDALGYNSATGSGGPDGSIQFELERKENLSLVGAVQAINSVKKDLQRTKVASFGDLCAFGGAEALESVGAPRIIVQVGRYDAKTENKDAVGINWDAPTLSGINEAFASAGLGPKDIAIMLGGLGEVSRVVAETIAATKTVEEDEDDAEFEPTPFVPTTFGARDAIYGAKVGKGDFGSKYFQSLIKGKFDSADNIGPLLVADEKIKEYIKKYALSETALKQDVVDIYGRVNLLGQAYTTRNS